MITGMLNLSIALPPSTAQHWRMPELTIEDLEVQQSRAALCGHATLPSEDLSGLLDLAMRANGGDLSKLDRLLHQCGGNEVTVSGSELRMILDLALRAKRSGATQRPALRLVRIPPRKK